MNNVTNPQPAILKLEGFLAKLLDYGTYLACAIIAAGFATAIFLTNARAMSFVALGVVLIIALPIIRVISMLVYFLKVGDRSLAVVAGLVLSIIFAGIFFGLKG